MAKALSGGLLTELFQGAPDGMNISLPPDEIAPTQDRYIQDGLVDKPGRVRRRGPVKNANALATLTRQAWGFVQTQDPTGAIRYAILNGSGANAKLSLLSNNASTINTEISWPTVPTVPPYPAVNVGPALNGGVFIGTAVGYGPQSSGNVSLAQWFGANAASYTTGTANTTKGSTTVTGTGTTWVGNVVPGMFLRIAFDDGTTGIAGVVQTVNSNTNISLVSPALNSATTKAYTLTSVTDWANDKVYKGAVTCSTGHPHIKGGDTKWLTMLSAGMLVFRLRDFTYIGTVTSIQSDFAATLTGNAAVDCADDPYVAFKPSGNTGPTTYTFSSPAVGFISAVYAGRQWFANNPSNTGLFGSSATAHPSRVWFSDENDPRAVDTTTDGDWFDIYSANPTTNPIVSLTSTQSSLLLHKPTETWAIFGSTPETFAARQLDAEGCVDAGSVQPYGAGAIWAGREGIRYFDGTRISNLTQNTLGKYWADIVKSFDSSQYRMFSMIARNHYFLFIENCTGPVPIVKGASSTTPSRLTLSINLLTGALSFHTNLDIRGAVTRTTFLSPTTFYLVNDASIGHICSADDLFDSASVDAITCTGNVAGPDFYRETRAHDAGDPTRVKRWRWLQTNSLVQGDTLVVDAVLGLSSVDQVLPKQILTSSVYSVDNRIDVNWDSQLLALRFYQNSSSVTTVEMGPYEIGFKYQRAGRPL